MRILRVLASFSNKGIPDDSILFSDVQSFRIVGVPEFIIVRQVLQNVEQPVKFLC